MAVPPSLYTIRIRGRLGATALSAFPAMAAELNGAETVLTGVLEDQSAMFGVLAQIEALGLELLELRPAGPAPGAESPASGEGSSP
ncbi:MAG TPA: hypothetical protein VGH57_20830 [Amycolatopsis sp.]